VHEPHKASDQIHQACRPLLAYGMINPCSTASVSVAQASCKEIHRPSGGRRDDVEHDGERERGTYGGVGHCKVEPEDAADGDVALQ